MSYIYKMEEKIINFAKTIDIEMIGFAKYYESKELKQRHLKKFELNYDVPINYNPNNINRLTKLLPEVKTIISIALPYYNSCEQLENIKANEVYFSSSSWGKDYHKVLDEKMDQIINYIKQKIPEFKYFKCVDTKPIDDRFWAHQAGIGFFGKNGLLINPKYGSYIFIGNILTNLELKPSKILNMNCKLCNKCVENCPVHAISENGINSRKCLSYLTQKKDLTENEKKQINQCIYGCDICQKVCPHNKINKGYHEFEPSGIEFINVDKYEKLSNKKFKEKYGNLSGSWRGKKIIERNIKIYKEKIANKNSM